MFPLEEDLLVTLDSDFVINPSLLGDDPQLEAAVRGARFDLTLRPEGHIEPGIWLTPTLVEGRHELIPVDLIVPEGAAPPGGRRGTRLGVHSNRAARRILRLEAVLIDHSPMEIMPPYAADTRSITAEVAGQRTHYGMDPDTGEVICTIFIGAAGRRARRAATCVATGAYLATGAGRQENASAAREEPGHCRWRPLSWDRSARLEPEVDCADGARTECWVEVG